ncbi:hypothetical protein ACOM2C_06605 [Pseudarthrobacter sp. So.54]
MPLSSLNRTGRRQAPEACSRKEVPRAGADVCTAEAQGCTVEDVAERGSAVVEFTFLSLLLMVPLVYFIITMAQLQGGSFAVVGAADQAAKVFVAQPDAAASTRPPPSKLCCWRSRTMGTQQRTPKSRPAVHRQTARQAPP